MRLMFASSVLLFASALMTELQLEQALHLPQGAAPSPANLTCMIEYCAKESVACIADVECDKNLICSMECMLNWDNDPTPEKYHAQNCTTKCGVTYENEIIDEYMTCVMSHKCITFPPIDVQCPQGLDQFIDPTASLTSMKGEWWQHYGHNLLWDCYPCQHIHSMEPNADGWAYTYSYELFTVDDELKYFGQTWQLPNNEPGKVANITYEYLGTLHNESWYLLQAVPDRYILLVDCSYMFTWTNVGSIVWVRPNVVLTPTEITTIAAVYKKALGWNFPDDFCPDQHGPSCPTNTSVPMNSPGSRQQRIHQKPTGFEPAHTPKIN